MSARLESTFARCREEQRAALITYVMAGDPSPRGALEMALACIQGGADILEIGMPFSDPIADGPTLQKAAMRSLEAGTTVESCLELCGKLRKKHAHVPLVLMGYLNPVLAYGVDAFFAQCSAVGADGLILPDLPPEESGELKVAADAHGISVVFLAAPTSTPSRLEAIRRAASGFLYFVSVTGVTGAKRAQASELAPKLAELRKLSPVPVVVGFGIAEPDQAREFGRLADGVVVGSAIVERVGRPGPVAKRAKDVHSLVKSLAKALRRD